MADIRILLFDMDGVLVDVSGSYRRVIAETVEHFTGRPLAPDAIQRLKNQGGYNDDWEVSAALIRQAGVEVPFAEVVDAFNRRYRGTAWDGLIASEPALIDRNQLDAARATHDAVGLVTGRPWEEALFTLSRFDWQDHFDVVVAMEDVEGRGKPDPYPIRLALSRLAEQGRSVPSPNQVAYVGDSVDDVVAARSSGCRAVGFVPPYLDPHAHAALLRSRGAETVIHDHTTLAGALSRLPD